MPHAIPSSTPSQMAAVDQVLEKYCHGGTNGLHCAAFFVVNSKGETIYERAIGKRSLEQGAPPLEMDSVYWTGSLAKFMAGLASMIAVEKGLMTLETDLRNVIPFFKTVEILRGFDEATGKPIMEPLDTPITLRHCLTHSNGFAYDMMDKDLRRWAEYTGKTESGFCGSMKGYEYPLIYKPGESWRYGPGMDWACHAIEILTGQSVEDFMRENIWSKLGMDSTTFHPLDYPNINKRRVQVAARAPTGELNPGQAPYSPDAEDCCAGVGIYSSPADIQKLLAAVARGGSPIVKTESLDQMLTPQLNDPSAFLNVIGNTHHAFLGQQWPKGMTKGNFGLCGNLVGEDLPGRRRKDTVSYQGMAGIFSFYDRTTGVAGGFMTQVLPPGDPIAKACLIEAETALYASLTPEITKQPIVTKAISQPTTDTPSGTQEKKLLSLNILGYRKPGMDPEAYRKYMTETHAALVSGLMAKYGFVRYSMSHPLDSTRGLMSQIYDPQFANVADEDCVIQIVFPSVDNFVRFKADPFFKKFVGPDHENFADTKRSRMTIGWTTEVLKDGYVVRAEGM